MPSWCACHTNQGCEFINNVSSELHRLTGREQRVTSAYHPQANGLVERNNRTIENSLLKVLNQKPEDWPDALPGVLFAYNTSRHKSTRYTPFFLLYGRDAVLSVQVSNQSLSKKCLKTQSIRQILPTMSGPLSEFTDQPGSDSSSSEDDDIVTTPPTTSTLRFTPTDSNWRTRQHTR